MKIYHYNDPVIKEMLCSFFQEGSLVPVFGAGFTVGETAESGKKVPNGAEFKEIMLDQLSENGLPEKEIVELRKEKFSEVCDIYFDPDLVQSHIIKETLQNLFLTVSLNEEKKSLLNNIDWKYIYTLNIDDAIEKHSKFQVIQPYDSNLTSKSRDFKPLYKLHGDVFYEITHDTDRLVFRKASYLESIESNKQMLSLLQEDLLNKNIIYIGCSLSDEDDIAFLIAAKSTANRNITKRIVFLNAEPGIVESKRLARHGINTIIIFDKGEYSQPYQLIQEAYSNTADSDAELNQYILNLKKLSKDPEENKSYLITGVVEAGKGQSSQPSILPYYYTTREKENDIINAILENGIVIVSGPRISGKTLTIKNIAGKTKDRKVFFIESGTILESHYINKMMGLRNTLIVFDAKTVDVELARLIRERSKILKENGTTLLCIIDNNDENLIESLSSTRLDQPTVIQISRVLSANETKSINNKFRTVRCPAFYPNKKLLDNLFKAYSILGQNTVIRKTPKEKELLTLLYILNVKRNIIGDWVKYITPSYEQLENLVKQCTPYLEYEKIRRSELASHTGYKIICNSDTWLLSVIAELYKNRGVAWCIDALFNLIRNIPQEDYRLSIELTLFDNLNFAFAGEAGGAADLILGLYEKIEEVRGTQAEFFVQKAKAYYNMYRQDDVVDKLGDRLNELRVAETWAQSDNDRAALRNIRHISTLLSLRRSYENNHADVEYVIDALEKVFKILTENHSNIGYVNNLILGNLRGSEYLTTLLTYTTNSSPKNIKLLPMKEEIKFIKARIKGSM